MDYMHMSVYYRGPPLAITRRPRPRSLCARCGGIAQEDIINNGRAKSSDRGPCNLSIEVDGRQGRQDRRRTSSVGRERRSRGDNPLPCYLVTTGDGKKAVAERKTTYKESFRSPPPEELKKRKIRSLPSSPITASTVISLATSPGAQRRALARKMASTSNRKQSDDSDDLVRQTECSYNTITAPPDHSNDPESPHPAKGRGNSSFAEKSKLHQPIWGKEADNIATRPRRPNKSLAHQPIWSDGPADSVSTPRRPNKGLMHQPLWNNDGSTPPPDPAPRRSPAKGLSHQPLWTANGIVENTPHRATPRQPTGDAGITPPAAGIRTHASASANHGLLSWNS